MANVPKQIFEMFLKKLGDTDVPKEMVAELSKTIENKTVSEADINKILFPPTTEP